MSNPPSMYHEPTDPGVVRHDRIRCPACRKPVDSAGSTDGKPIRPPRTGDFSVCFGCAEPAVYEVGPLGVTLRTPTDDERAKCLAENAEPIAQLKKFIAQQRRQL